MPDPSRKLFWYAVLASVISGVIVAVITEIIVKRQISRKFD